jgi:hypothetical protein
MPPHSSHLLQPLDVSYFTVLKRSYGRQIEGLMRTGVNHINKPDFLTAYLSAHKESMTSDTICSGFAATGLVLYDLERVLSKLNTQLRTPTPPLAVSPKQSHWVSKTPHDVSQLELQAKAIKEYLSRRTKGPPSPTDQALNQLVKGCQLAMHSVVLLTEENKQLRAVNRRQKRKRPRKREYIATGGVLTVREGLNQVQISNLGPNSGVKHQTATAQPRAPRLCSVCRSPEYTARTCPQRYISN